MPEMYSNRGFTMGFRLNQHVFGPSIRLIYLIIFTLISHHSFTLISGDGSGKKFNRAKVKAIERTKEGKVFAKVYFMNYPISSRITFSLLL